MLLLVLKHWGALLFWDLELLLCYLIHVCSKRSVCNFDIVYIANSVPKPWITWRLQFQHNRQWIKEFEKLWTKMQLQEGITWDLHDSHPMQKKQTSVFPGRCCLWRKIQWCCLLQIILDRGNRPDHYTTDWPDMGRSHKSDNIEDAFASGPSRH